ncbi:late competence development ComFB family protein [Pleionea sp. CnH1-48]|uniref:late competence development ComFB family protein n=1 Tax=Pleionea sp. CnH1-48 TaxID=2954494 RepID=UPI0020977C48|nr:late competence development ComFB family protein [Pleionea sp. CnH1-48]MCO7227262.1 late competence development ComFB family protein [Pleionea sp. CnH1-48]
MFKDIDFRDGLENLSEQIVFEEINDVIESGEPEFNVTDIAIQDIAAIALNNMPPKYVCNILEKQNPGPTLMEEVKDLKKYARRQVLKAIKRVKDNPHD